MDTIKNIVYDIKLCERVILCTVASCQCSPSCVRDLNCVSHIPLKVIIQSGQQGFKQIMAAGRRATSVYVCRRQCAWMGGCHLAEYKSHLSQKEIKERIQYNKNDSLFNISIVQFFHFYYYGLKIMKTLYLRKLEYHEKNKCREIKVSHPNQPVNSKHLQRFPLPLNGFLIWLN